MKKMFMLLYLFILSIFFVACKENDLNKDDLNLTDELSIMFKTAYANSIKKRVENADLNEINILSYYGKIDDVYVVSMNNEIVVNKLNVYPYDIYDEIIEKMRFYYSSKKSLYLVFEETLYTIKTAYEEKIITLADVCLLFGIHSMNLETFTKDDYKNIFNSLELNYSDSYQRYNLLTYFGKYNDYNVVNFDIMSVFPAVITEKVGPFMFTYGYPEMAIQVINKKEVLSLTEAYERVILYDEDLYNIFSLETNSAEINKEIIDMLLNSVYNFLLSIKDELTSEPDINNIYLTKYIGEHYGYHIFNFETDYKLKSNSTNSIGEEFISLKNGLGERVLIKDGKLIPLKKAYETGVIKEEEYLSIIKLFG